MVIIPSGNTLKRGTVSGTGTVPIFDCFPEFTTDREYFPLSEIDVSYNTSVSVDLSKTVGGDIDEDYIASSAARYAF